MELIYKKDGEKCYSGDFNMSSISEIIVYYQDGSCSSDFISNYNVKLKNGTIKDLHQAFVDHDVITDNYNTYFHEPSNEEEKQRGFSLC